MKLIREYIKFFLLKQREKKLIASLVGDNRINSQKHYVTFLKAKQDILVFRASNWFAIFPNFSTEQR